MENTLQMPLKMTIARQVTDLAALNAELYGMLRRVAQIGSQDPQLWHPKVDEIRV